jgi:hypothetical protein
MVHHYMAIYGERGRVYIESWLQINLFGRCFCFWRKKQDITDHDFNFLRSGDASEPEGMARMHAMESTI